MKGLLLALTAITTLWWTVLQLTGIKDSPSNYLFALFYGLIPIIFGCYILLKPHDKTKANPPLLTSAKLFSLGLIFWGVGEAIWSYYNLFLNVKVPYPSLADAAFVLSLPMWSFGTLYLSKGLGLPFFAKTKLAKALVVAIPAVVVVVAYYLLFNFARGGPLEFGPNPVKTFFDISYPLWGMVLIGHIIVVDALLLSHLSGEVKLSVDLLSLGFILSFFADVIFTRQTTMGTFYNGGTPDLLYALSLSLISLGTLTLNTSLSPLSPKEGPTNLLKEKEEQLKEVSSKLREREELLQRVNEQMYKKNLELIEEKRKAEALLYSITEAAIVTDDFGKIILFNRSAQNLFMVKEDDSIGKPFIELVKVQDQKGNSVTVSSIKELLSFKQGVKLTDLILKRGDNKDRYLDLTASKVSLKDLTLFVIIISDVTEELKAEKAREEFISIASHELRTPMTIIKNYLWMLQNKKGGELNPKQGEYVDKAIVSTERMIKLISDMLDISRMEQGRFEIHPKQVNISAMVEEIAPDFKIKADQKGLSFKTQLPKDPVFVRADEDKLREVLVNLLSNAIKYTDNGSVLLEIKQEDKNVRTSVIDTGRGVAKDDIQKLFHKFGRLDNTFVTAAESGGTGLGLYIVKSIVEAMGGKVSISSPGVGKGSTFWFILRSV